MKAVYFPSINSNLKEIEVDGPQFLHLSKSLRVRVGDEVLALNGNGLTCKCRVDKISKRSIILVVIESKVIEKLQETDLAICLPKKDAFELIVRMSQEFGVNNLIPVKSKYSQFEIRNNERLNTILQSALIQSNSPYLTEINKTLTLSELINLFPRYEQILFFSTEISGEKVEKICGKTLIIIGPEAGFDKEEVQVIKKQESMMAVHLNCPILRAPTATSAALGMVSYLRN